MPRFARALGFCTKPLTQAESRPSTIDTDASIAETRGGVKGFRGKTTLGERPGIQAHSGPVSQTGAGAELRRPAAAPWVAAMRAGFLSAGTAQPVPAERHLR